MQLTFTPLVLYCNNVKNACQIGRDSKYMSYTGQNATVNFCMRCWREVQTTHIKLPLEEDHKCARKLFFPMFKLHFLLPIFFGRVTYC